MRGMRNTLLFASLLLLLLLPLSGCAWSPTVRTDHDTTMSFEGWNTWAWAPQNSGEGVGAVAASLYDARIRRSVEATLAGRGYRSVPADEADFLVAYAVVIRNQSDVLVWDDPGWDYRWRRGARPSHASVQHYQVGSLILDVIQRRSESIAWRGWAEAEVQQNVDPAERDRRIDVAVQKILDRFPPQ
jgi:hypothetical protein